MEVKTGSILALAKCSKKNIKCLLKRVAAYLFAVTLIMYFETTLYAYTITSISGLTEWQKPVASRSLNAVLEKISPAADTESLKSLIKIVSDKLFGGYRTQAVSIDDGNIMIDLTPAASPPMWSVSFEPPKLSAPSAEWFNTDLSQVHEPVISLIEGVPVDALAWCDAALRDKITEVLLPMLPGWKPSFIVHYVNEKAELQISFSPELPLLLAVNPSFSSNTLPTLVNSELKHNMLGEFAPFIGLPVVWARRHSTELNKWAEGFIASQNIVSRTASVPKANFIAAPVSQLNVNVESSHYNVWGWAAVYAGTKERSAELGVHLGRRTEIVPNWYMEFYGEGILELKNWNTEGRLGMRWSPWGDVWIGGEWSSKDDMWWGRFSIDPRLHKPYAWIRVREDGEINTALGWKATEHISFELHYDDRDEDRWSLRMMGNL